MRVRLCRVFEDSGLCPATQRLKVEAKLGIRIPTIGGGGRPYWLSFFETSLLRDLLDFITIVAKIGLEENTAYRKAAQEWIKEVRTVFQEENVRYRVDDAGVVHFSVDGEFAHNVRCLLAALEAPRYRAARGHFEAGQEALDAVPAQTREAIRQTYEAVETVFRLIFPEVARLTTSDVDKRLSQQALLGLEGTERDCTKSTVAAFKDWIVSAQGYRHGKGTEAPDNPSIPTAVLNVSVGASFLRWLAEIDANALSRKNQTAAGD